MKRKIPAFGSVAWQEYMEKNIAEKKKKGAKIKDLSDMERLYLQVQAEHNIRLIKQSKLNPPVKMTKIYDNCLAIIAVKGLNSNFKGSKFIHKFKDRPKIYGLHDGSILIKGKNPLWKVFNYKV